MLKLGLLTANHLQEAVLPYRKFSRTRVYSIVEGETHHLRLLLLLQLLMQLPQRRRSLVVRIRRREDGATAVTGGTGRAECMPHGGAMVGPGIFGETSRTYAGRLVQV